MKTLLLLRHAKSSWDDREIEDHDRPLAPRGERAASLIGAYFEQEALQPELVLCSSAVRAVHTLERVLPHLVPAPRVTTERSLHHASAGRLLERLHQLEEPLTSVLLVAHNPGIHDLALGLSASDGPVSRALRQKFPTAALAEIRLDPGAGGWPSLDLGAGKLVRFVTPKMLV